MRYLVGTLGTIAVALGLAAATVACGAQEAQGYREVKPMLEKPIEQVLKDQTDTLMALPGVVGTGQGLCTGEPCIKVYVAQKTADLLEQIPSEIEGYAVDVQETGEFKALPSP